MRPPRALLLSASLLAGCSSSTTSSTGRTSGEPSSHYVPDQDLHLSMVDKLDLVFMIDSSPSMADKQMVLAQAIPDLLNRLVSPSCLGSDGSVMSPADHDGRCASGSVPEFDAVRDIHIAVVTSSLGGHGADSCLAASPSVASPDDHGRPITRKLAGGDVPTYDGKGFLAWDPDGVQAPAGEGQASNLLMNFSDMVKGADQKGCGFEASLEAWYRFLIDPNPPATVALSVSGDATKGARGSGTDTTLLQQRAAFLRPDSLVAIVSVSDENDCSIIDGTLPHDVCEKPTFDANGNPTGCTMARTPWPANYARGNFQGYTEQNGGVTGTPFPANNLAAQSGLPLSEPPGIFGACSDGSQAFCLAPGTSECMDNPDWPACRSCYLASDGACSSASTLPAPADPVNLRCWNQKQRFGVDMLYPLQRYIDGLSQDTVYDRDGFRVPNPLYDDLPYRAAVASGTVSQLGRGRVEARPSRLVFFAPIVGVPWQDIARNQGDLATGGSTPPDLTAGYLPTAVGGDAQDRRTIDWDRILGNPLGHDGKPRVDPKDPLMIETNVSDDPRHLREGQTHPVTGETIGASVWNSVNGREQPGLTDRLQYACLFDLPSPMQVIAGPKLDVPDAIPATPGPLSERRQGGSDASPSYDEPLRQYRAGAYPGTRFLQVAKTFSANVPGNAVVASICAPNLVDPAAPDYGYRPATAAIVDSLKVQLTGQCLPRILPTTDGVAACVLLDARFAAQDRDGNKLTNDAAQVAACRTCQGAGRRPLDPQVAASLTGSALAYECLCEIEQLAGDDLTACQSRTEEPLSSTLDATGWCYVDPQSPDMPDPQAAGQIVSMCPSTLRRGVRFVGLGRADRTLVLACRE